jgi:hypothetical protein
MATIKRKCDVCKKDYEADSRNTKRGWGLCCSKSCAAKKREKSKPSYNTERVKENNIRRSNWFAFYDSFRLDYDGADDDQWGDCDFGIHE